MSPADRMLARDEPFFKRYSLASIKDPLGVQPTARRLYNALSRGLKRIERMMVQAANDEAIAVTAAQRPLKGELSGAPDEAAAKAILFYDRLVQDFVHGEAEGDEGYVERNMDAAYRLGQRAAFDSAATPRRVQREIRRLPSHRSATRAATRQTLDRVTGLTDDIRKQMRDEIADGLRKREAQAEIAARLRQRFRVADTRAAAIAQTEAVRAHAQGSLNTLRSLRFERVTASVEFTLNVHGGSTPCPQCIELEGVVYTIDQAEGIIPVHPRCQAVVSEGVISNALARKAYRRKYSGDLLTLRSADGYRATITPHHPVLTDKGFIPAHLLRPGEHRLAYRSPVESPAAYDQHEPALASQVFESLMLCRDMVLSEVPISAPDFHGDGADGDVDVVWPYRDLLAYRYATLAEFIRKLLLDADMGLPFFNEPRPLGEQLRALFLASPRPLCRVEGLAPALRQLSLIAQLLRLARAAELNPSLEEPVAHRVVSEAAALRQRSNRVASMIGRDLIRFSGFEISSTCAHGETVYDFQTANAMYACNGLLVSNCGWVPVVDK